MDAAYFVGRKELLDWLNSLLDLKLAKIEETAPGHIACMIFDMMFPQTIPMSRVNWEARSDYEFVQNYKLLQNGFNKHHVQRHVDVDKLIRAKYQDNLEFMQWFKAFYDQSGVFKDEGEYSPSSVRARGKGGKKFNEKHGSGRGGNGGGGVAARSSRGAAGGHPKRPAAAVAARPQPKAKHQQQQEEQLAPNSPRSSRPLRERPSANEGKASSAAADAALLLKNAELQGQAEELEMKNGDLHAKVDDLELAVLEIEKERDFYFEKLRNVEVMLQVHQEKGEESNVDHLVDKIFKVLYATAEDSIVVNDEGEVVDASFLSQEEVVDAV